MLCFKVLLHTRKYGTDPIDETISLDSYLQCDGTFEIIDLCQKWREDLRRKVSYHIGLISIDSHEKILIVSL